MKFIKENSTKMEKYEKKKIILLNENNTQRKI